MRVHYGFDNLPEFTDPVVTVGSYDGVHRGHAQLLDMVKKLASDKNGESVVITFFPHPRKVAGDGKGVGLLNSLKEKIYLLDKTGIDHLIVAPFTDGFSKVSSYDFVRNYLIDKVRVGTLIVGYNHHFGSPNFICLFIKFQTTCMFLCLGGST